jgi:hypothetical protein
MRQQQFGTWMAAAVAAVGLMGGMAIADTVEVTPSNMNGWSFQSFDPNFNPVSTGPDAGTGEMTTGPAGQPLGTGSAHLATNPGNGDGGVDLETNNLNGTALSALTSLSYSTYVTANNGQQFPYLIIGVSTTGGTTADDFLEFEPPYDAVQATALNTWQSWNTLTGGWYDANGTLGSGPGSAVVSLSDLLNALPSTATIADLGTLFPGFGGINLQVGLASPGDNFDANVDDFTLGTAAGSTSYDFDPDANPTGGAGASTPLPSAASMGLGMLAVIGAAGMLRKKLRTA